MRTLFKWLFLVGLFVVVVVGLAGRTAWNRVHEPFKGYVDAEQIVDISPGATTTAIAGRLADAGVVSDAVTFRVAVALTGRSRSLKAGEYLFTEPMTPMEVVDKLARGDVYARRITFPEGLTIPELAAIYEMRGFGAARDFEAAARDRMSIVDLDPRASDLEGYLFPETYAVPRATPATELVMMMIERFRAVYSDELQRRAKEEGLSTREVMTLASLVEKETARPDERPLVAAVYRNRMKIRMPMQADPTVVYALQKAKKYDGNLRRADLSFNSPYNTYRYPGLPPGPIAAPGKASIDAVLAPAQVKYLYFVSRNDGSHVFAETLQEHNRNVNQYQVQYFRQQRQSQGAGGRGQGQRGQGGRGQGGEAAPGGKPKS